MNVGKMHGMMLALWLALAVLSQADDLETIEGVRLSGTLQAITAAGEVTGAGIEPGTSLDSLRSIMRNVKSSPGKSKFILETHGDGRLLVDAVTLADDKFTARLAGGKDVVLPLDAVRCLRFEPDLVMAAFKESLEKPSADQDKIFVKVDNQIDAISGLIVGLTDKELTFEYEAETRKLPRERLHGIVLAQAGGPKNSPATVQLTNGSRLAGKLLSLEQGDLQLELVGGSKASLPFDSVERIDLRSPRMIYLSELEPAAVREETLLTIARPWQKDRSVSGKTLTLAGQAFPRGLGVHARSELVFDVPEGFDVLAATVGIDASTGGRGDCDFAVLGDDRPLWSQRIKGSDAPQSVRVELRGVKKVTLRVEPGADFDFGDHADWCDARFLKSK